MTNISLPELPLPVLANNQTHQCWFTAEQMMDFAKDAVRIYRLTSTNNTSKQAAGEVVAYKCDRARVVGYWNCQCAECRERAANNTIGTTPPRHPADEGMAIHACTCATERDRELCMDKQSCRVTFPLAGTP